MLYLWHFNLFCNKIKTILLLILFTFARCNLISYLHVFLSFSLSFTYYINCHLEYACNMLEYYTFNSVFHIWIVWCPRFMVWTLDQSADIRGCAWFPSHLGSDIGLWVTCEWKMIRIEREQWIENSLWHVIIHDFPKRFQ